MRSPTGPAIHTRPISTAPGRLHGLVRPARVFLIQHVPWSVNSLCHLLGTRPFATRRHDRATNPSPLALLSMGESWHNTHHSDPTCAPHGVDRGQIDLPAGVIRLLERLRPSSRFCAQIRGYLAIRPGRRGWAIYRPYRLGLVWK